MSTRTLIAACCALASAMAAPPLTTIQDTLYKADGSRFNGSLTISWNSFEGPDSSAIVTQNMTVKVNEGLLKVQLVPTTTSNPAAFYTVVYNSDGRVQFRETWAVPASTLPVRVRDVRTATQISSGQTAEAITGPIQESDVVGLVADLSARPVKGPGFAAGRVAMVNEMGALESVTGSDTDCVRVDGSSGPCGGQSVAFVDGEVISGIVDGSNATFSLAAIPEPLSSLSLYRNGLRQKIGQDYTIDQRTIGFVPAAVPQPGDTLLASYRLGTEESNGTPQYFPAPQVLCSGVGAATSSLTAASIGACHIPASAISPGDRIEIRFQLEHQGTANGFVFEIRWGGTVMLTRTAGAGDALAAGRIDVAMLSTGAQFSTQSWGTVLPLNATVGSANDPYDEGLMVDFRGALLQAGDSLTLRNYTVIRYP